MNKKIVIAIIVSIVILIIGIIVFFFLRDDESNSEGQSVTPQVVATPAVTPQVVATPAVTSQVVATPAVTSQVVATPAVTPQVVATPAVTPQVVATPAVTPQVVATPAVAPQVVAVSTIATVTPAENSTSPKTVVVLKNDKKTYFSNTNVTSSGLVMAMPEFGASVIDFTVLENGKVVVLVDSVNGIAMGTTPRWPKWTWGNSSMTITKKMIGISSLENKDVFILVSDDGIIYRAILNWTKVIQSTVIGTSALQCAIMTDNIAVAIMKSEKETSGPLVYTPDYNAVSVVWLPMSTDVTGSNGVTATIKCKYVSKYINGKLLIIDDSGKLFCATTNLFTPLKPNWTNISGERLFKHVSLNKDDSVHAVGTGGKILYKSRYDSPSPWIELTTDTSYERIQAITTSV